MSSYQGWRHIGSTQREYSLLTWWSYVENWRWATWHSPRMILPSRSLICVTLSSNTYHNKTSSKGQSDLGFLCSKISYSRSTALQCSGIELHVNFTRLVWTRVINIVMAKINICTHNCINHKKKMKYVQCKIDWTIASTYSIEAPLVARCKIFEKASFYI